MNELTRYETVDQRTAAKLAALYIGSFRNQPHNADVMLEQITRWCMTKPASVVNHICHPDHGAVQASEGPCLKSLNRWYEAWTQPTRPPREAPEHKPFLPEPDEPQEPDEVREAAVARWHKIRGSVVKSNCTGRPKGWKPIQQHHSLDELNARMER